VHHGKCARPYLQALVNLGNCKFERAAAEADEGSKEALLSEARDLYEAAARNEPDCLEAVYNLGLAAKACQQYDVALEQFILLNGLLPNQVWSCRRAHEPVWLLTRVATVNSTRKRNLNVDQNNSK
jgi:tetratricopeptide (TPR) repeat protein